MKFSKKEKPKMKSILLKIEQSQYEILFKAAKKNQATVTEMIRWLIANIGSFR